MTTDNLTALEARDQWLLIARLWPTLQHALAGRAGNGLTGMPAAASPERQLPIDVHVSDLMHEITGVVEGYAAILLAETKWEPTTSRMPQLLTEVANRYGHFVSDPDLATGFTDDAHEYAEKVTRTLNPTPRPTYIGPCPIPNCEGELRLRPDHEHARCPNCGTTTTTTQQRDWLEQQMQELHLTPTEIIRALKTLKLTVSDRTVWRWIDKGKLTEAEEDTGIYPLARAIHLAERKMPTTSEHNVA